MPIVDLGHVTRRYGCSSCSVTAEIPAAVTRVPLHACSAHNGFRVPMVPYGSGDHVFTTERGDYLRGEDVPLDADGRPIMRAEVERADGHRDVWVYAPTAHAEMRS